MSWSQWCRSVSSGCSAESAGCGVRSPVPASSSLPRQSTSPVCGRGRWAGIDRLRPPRTWRWISARTRCSRMSRCTMCGWRTCLAAEPAETWRTWMRRWLEGSRVTRPSLSRQPLPPTCSRPACWAWQAQHVTTPCHRCADDSRMQTGHDRSIGRGSAGSCTTSSASRCSRSRRVRPGHSTPSHSSRRNRATRCTGVSMRIASAGSRHTI